jgi:hypothetical protein
VGVPRRTGFDAQGAEGIQGGLAAPLALGSRVMKLFRRQSKTAAQTGPPPAEMRGRAAEIADPAALDWEVVWEALKTEPPAENAATITQDFLEHIADRLGA